jgi:hypothetical protein
VEKIYARGDPSINKIIFKLKKLNNIYLLSKMESEKKRENNLVLFFLKERKCTKIKPLRNIICSTLRLSIILYNFSFNFLYTKQVEKKIKNC